MSELSNQEKEVNQVPINTEPITEQNQHENLQISVRQYNSVDQNDNNLSYVYQPQIQGNLTPNHVPQLSETNNVYATEMNKNPRKEHTNIYDSRNMRSSTTHQETLMSSAERSENRQQNNSLRISKETGFSGQVNLRGSPKSQLSRRSAMSIIESAVVDMAIQIEPDF